MPGETIDVLLLAPAGSGGRLRPSSRRAVTDASGLATLPIVFETGASGDYTLLFSAKGILERLGVDGLSTLAAEQAASLATQIQAAVTEVVIEAATDEVLWHRPV